jgi:hypothetical protein
MTSLFIFRLDTYGSRNIGARHVKFDTEIEHELGHTLCTKCCL